MTVIIPKKAKNSPAEGFTILELLVVVAIIGVLAAIAIPAYTDYINKAKLTLAYGALDSVRKAMELYHIDHQKYPDSIVMETGKDGSGNTVFDDQLVQQLKTDLTVTGYNYDSGQDTYTMTAKGNDSEKTELTLTPKEIIRTP